ncbi:MAG TPA: response regulator [Candidatus Acidoferrales bacterium]|nr:response regulator [Candidatus Acidoferrales bacterium]
MPVAHSSIRKKLTRLVLITSAAALVVSCAIFAVYDVYISRQTTLQSLTTVARIAGANSSAAVAFGDAKSAAEILNALRSEKQIMHAALYTPNGKVLASYSRDPAGMSFTPPPAGSDQARFDGNRIVVFQSVKVNGHSEGLIYLESDVSAITAREKGLAAMLGIALLVSLLVALIVGPKLQKPITGPIFELARTAFAISVHKNYSVRVVPKSNDEISYLYTQFNRMLERIQQHDTELEQIRADLEERVAERTAFLSALIEAIPLGTVAFDQSGAVLSTNPGFTKIFNYSQEEVVGKILDELIVPTEFLTEGREYTRIPLEGQTFQFESPRKRKDGSLVNVEVHGVPLFIQGKIAGGFAIYQDITERHRSEEAIRKLSQALEQSAESVTITDKDGVVEYVNPCFTNLTGYSREEAVGQTPRILKSGKHQVGFYQDFWATILAGEVYRGIFINKKKSGELFYEEKTIAPVKDAQGTITNFVSVGRDITVRKQAEEELKKAKEAAEEASRAKSDFLANMSHEIRTPMNGIIGMTDLTLETALTTEQRDYLTMVKTSADALLRVINDILDFSKIEAGKFELEREPFALRESVGETMKLLGHLAHRKKLELAWQAAADVPEWVVGDCGRLRQILVNLVGNAIKFTERGEVVVSVRVENFIRDGVELHFLVSDTGIGIPREKQSRIFEAFTQADGSSTRKYGGTGLGLAIAQRLVNLQEGSLWVESEAGKGSVFHFTLRLGLPDKSFVAPKELGQDLVRGLRALVVDDNRTNRVIEAELLGRWGMSPEEAESGKQALEVLERAEREGKPFRLIVLDAQMPEMDGFTLARRIKEDARYSAAAIIMLSSGARPGEVSRLREVGISAYLTKPAQPSELLDSILNAVTNSDNNPADPAPPVSPNVSGLTASGLRILLAEDNAVNRQLATRLLEKRGYSVTAVNDGRQAVEAVERGNFHVVLMDVQMPEMDGLEATRMIRKKEESTGTHLPVIAVTAHVMKGDREKCLEAGTDDYVSKPIQPEELYAAIERLQSSPKGSEVSSMKIVTASSAAVLDPEELLEHVQGDRELLTEIIRIFRTEIVSLLQALREAVEKGDASAISRVSHTLKGSVGNFGSGPAYQIAKKMDEFARTGETAAPGALLPALEAEIERLQVALEPFCGTEGK